MPDESGELAELRASVERLSQKITDLEERLRAVEGHSPHVTQMRDAVAPPLRHETPPHSANPVAPPPLSAPSPAASANPAAKHQYRSEKLESRFGLTLVNRIGVITLVIGILFFFKYAVENRWVNESGRVLLGLAGGILALWIGDRLWKRGQGSFAQGISGLGIAALFISLYASFAYYQLVPHVVAFVGMALVTALACAASFRYASPAIAALGLIGGYLTPPLLSTGEDRPWALFSYILLLNLGAVFIAARRHWPGIEALAFGATILLFSGWFEKQFHPEKFWVAAFFLLVYYALFAPRRLPFAIASQIFVSIGLASVCGLSLFTTQQPQAVRFLWLLLLVTAASIALAEVRKWIVLVAVSFLLFWGYWFWSSAVLLSGLRSLGAATATIAFVLFLAWSAWRLLAQGGTASRFLLAIVPANAVFYFFAIWRLYKNENSLYLAIFALVLAGLYIVLSLQFRKAKANHPAHTLCLLIALGFITVAVPLAFSTYTITMTWALETVAISWLAWTKNEQRLRWGAAVLYALVVIRLLFFDLPLSTPRMIANARFLSFVVAAVCFWIGARWMGRSRTALITYCTGHALLLIAGAAEISEWAWQSESRSNVASLTNTGISILLAVYALILIALGVVRRFALNRILGLVLIGIVVLKLYFYDVWLLTRIYRIGAFVVLGILLLATSYLYSRFRHKIGSLFSDQPE